MQYKTPQCIHLGNPYDTPRFRGHMVRCLYNVRYNFLCNLFLNIPVDTLSCIDRRCILDYIHCHNDQYACYMGNHSHSCYYSCWYSHNHMFRFHTLCYSETLSIQYRTHRHTDQSQNYSLCCLYNALHIALYSSPYHPSVHFVLHVVPIHPG